MDETIIKDSSVGKRLDKIQQSQGCVVKYKGKKIPVVSKITIGRDKSNDIVLNNPLISRFHGVIQKIKEDFYIHDLESSNGTFVNGKRVPKGKYLKIKASDIIEIGKTKLKIGK